MNYELIMLRRYKRMRGLAKSFADEARNIAVFSYGYEFSCLDTRGQIEQILDRMQSGKDCAEFCKAVEKGLCAMDKPNRALLIAAYVKRLDAKELAARYRTSPSTVYRRLMQSRVQFRERLIALGYDYDWFFRNYSRFDFIAELL